MSDGPQRISAAEAAPGSVGRTMFWLSLGTLVYLGAQWLLTVVVVRLAGQSVNGDYTLALSSSSVAYAVVLFGMRPFQISDTRREYADAVYLASRAATSLFAVLAFAVSLLFTADLGRLWLVLGLFLGFRLTEGWFDVLHGVLQNADRMRLAGIALIVRAVTEVAAFTAVLAVTHELVWAVGVMFAVSLAALLALEWPWSRPHLDGRSFAEAGGWRRTADLLWACAPLLVANLAYSVMLFVPRNAVRAIWGAEELGYYGSIAAPLLLVPVLVSYLYTPFMPALAEHERSGRRRGLFVMAGKLLAAIVGLIGVCFALLPFVGPPVLALMFGEGVLSHVHLLWPVAGSVSLTALVYFGNALLTAVRRIPWTLYASIAALLVVLFSSTPFVQLAGTNGASFALIAGQGVQAVVLLVGFVTGRPARGAETANGRVA